MTQPYTDWLADRAHEGKVAYGSRRRAKKAAKRAARNCRERVADWGAYRCMVCQLWHVGHKGVPLG